MAIRVSYQTGGKEVEFDPKKEVADAHEEWMRGDRAVPFDAPTATEPDWSIVYNGDTPLIAVSKAYKCAIPKRPKMDDVGKEANLVALGDMQLTYAAAYHALRQARFILRQGPVNNIMPAEIEAETPRPDRRHRPSYICEPLSPDFLFQTGEDLERGLIYDGSVHLGQFTALLARFYRGVRTGAGVCSTISAVTTGLLTTNFPELRAFELDRSGDSSNIEYVKQTLQHSGNSDSGRAPRLCILNVSHGGDHSFCLVSFGNSPWFVCDPWPAEPYIIPLERNYFHEKGIKSWQVIEVFGPCEDPFGLPLMRAWDENAVRGEGAAIPGLTLKPPRIEHALALYSRMMVPEGTNMARREPFLWHAKGKCWVKDVEAPRTRGPGEFKDDLLFHEAHPWQHSSNHILSNTRDKDRKIVPEKEKAWLQYKSRNPPAAGPHDWGSGVTVDQEFVDGHAVVGLEDYSAAANEAAERDMARRQKEHETAQAAAAERAAIAKARKANTSDAKGGLERLLLSRMPPAGP